MDDAPSVIENLKIGLSLFSETLGLVRTAKDVLPESADREAIEKSLDRADTASKLAEAQIAQALGYKLCQCTFPPQVMLSVGYKGSVEEFRCSLCDKSSIAPPVSVEIPPTKHHW